MIDLKAAGPWSAAFFIIANDCRHQLDFSIGVPDGQQLLLLPTQYIGKHQRSHNGGIRFYNEPGC